LNLTSKMRKRFIGFKWAAVAVTAFFPMWTFGQGIESAASKFSATATAVKNNVQTGLLAIAFICAGIGLVSALSKTNVEGEQASKNFVKWFVAAGFFGICWTLMATIFS